MKFPSSPLPSAAMRSCALFTLFVALLAGSRGGNPGDERIVVVKCCDEYEMLSGDGRSCVKTDWPPNAHMRFNVGYLNIKIIISPLNEDWVRRWLPPGLPLHRINSVVHIPVNGVSLPVNASCEWSNPTCDEENVLKKQVVFFSDGYSVLRPTPGWRLRTVTYCVDAALPPLAPFVMRLRTKCAENECVKMCCDFGQVMVNKEGKWMCKENNQSDWTPFNTSFARYSNLEYPSVLPRNCPSVDLADSQDFTGISELYKPRVHIFSIWFPCSAYYRNRSTLQEVLFYCKYPNVAKGIYWTLRPLCVVSTLLLALAILSIACDGSMRRKVHGWCLASHALCLFGFNVGQIVFYVQVRDVFDFKMMTHPTSEYINACKYFALMMYFLLTAAWFWLTALCTNMALGFRLQAATPSRSGKKKFLVFSVLAWGLPTLLTIICSFLITLQNEVSLTENSRLKPSLAEVRVCFNEPLAAFKDQNDEGYSLTLKYFTYKYGTAIFYYGPVLSLVLFNVASLLITLRKIKRLRRGNSILRREEDLRHRHAQGNPPSAANIESANGGTSRSGNGGSTRREVDSKTIKMYLKMILMTGVLEIISEVIIWANTKITSKSSESEIFRDVDYTFDYHLPYRSSGHVTDFLRAACVAWLAAPEGGYLGPILRRLRGEKK